MKGYISLGIYLFALLHTNASVLGEERLIATHLDTRFSVTDFVNPYYDGKDSIYLFGGDRGHCRGVVKDIWQYTLSTDKLELLASLSSPIHVRPSSVQTDSEGSFFFIARNGSSIYKLKLSSNGYVGRLDEFKTPYNFKDSAVLKPADDSNLIYIIGSNENPTGIYRFEMLGKKTNFMGNLPRPFPFPTAVRVEAKAFIVGPSEDNSQSVGILDLETLKMKEIPGDVRLIDNPINVVTDGTYIYTWIKQGLIDTCWKDYQGLVRLNSRTLKWDFLPVRNLLDEESRYSIPPSPVYVDKLKRIYYFGGRYKTTSSGDISYALNVFIDLSSKSNANVFNKVFGNGAHKCKNPANGELQVQFEDDVEAFPCVDGVTENGKKRRSNDGKRMTNTLTNLLISAIYFVSLFV